MPDNNQTTNMFGSEDLKSAFRVLTSLFGDKQTREQSQQFSTSQVDDQNTASNTAATQAGLSNLNLQKDAANFGAGLGTQSYQSKLNADYNQAVKAKSLNQSAGSSSESFGLGAAAPSGYGINVYGQPTAFNASAVADWKDRQAGVLNDQISQAQRMSDIDLQKQDYLNIGLMNRQASIDAQNRANDFIRQKALDAQARASQERIASTQAQGNILGSLFGSVSAGSQNYRYWS